jgi:hypothetical protein
VMRGIRIEKLGAEDGIRLIAAIKEKELNK